MIVAPVILITGATEEDHLKNLDEVLKRLGTAGMWLKVEKCLFHQEKVEYPSEKFLGKKGQESGKNGKMLARMARSWQDSYALGQDNFFSSSIIKQYNC